MTSYIRVFPLLLSILTPLAGADDFIRDPQSICAWLGQANPTTGATPYTCKANVCSCSVTSSLGQKKIQWLASGNPKTVLQLSWGMPLENAEDKQYFGDISNGALSSWMQIPSFPPIKKAIAADLSTSWANEQYTIQYTFDSTSTGRVVIDLN